MLIVGASALRPCRELFTKRQVKSKNSSRGSRRRRDALRMLAPLAAACASLFLCASTTRAQASDEPVQVIPAPKSVAKTGEDFPLTRDVRVVLADPKSEDDQFAAQDFIADVRETAGVELRLGSGGGERGVGLGLAP